MCKELAVQGAGSIPRMCDLAVVALSVVATHLKGPRVVWMLTDWKESRFCGAAARACVVQTKQIWPLSPVVVCANGGESTGANHC